MSDIFALSHRQAGEAIHVLKRLHEGLVVLTAVWGYFFFATASKNALFPNNINKDCTWSICIKNLLVPTGPHTAIINSISHESHLISTIHKSYQISTIHESYQISTSHESYQISTSHVSYQINIPWVIDSHWLTSWLEPFEPRNRSHHSAPGPIWVSKLPFFAHLLSSLDLSEKNQAVGWLK